MIRTTLEAAGHTVDEASDGRAGLDRLSASGFDLILLDLSMPVLDGMGMLKALRDSVGPTPPVIVLTAYGSITAAVHATLAGAVDFLEKPSTPDDVRAAIAQALAAKHHGLKLNQDVLAGGYEAVLERVRDSLRAGAWENAESLLMKAADLSLRDAAYFNLLGVLYEARREHALARKFYGKAMATRPGGYPPAEQNIRRLYELQVFGKSHIDVELGERPAVLLRYR